VSAEPKAREPAPVSAAPALVVVALWIASGAFAAPLPSPETVESGGARLADVTVVEPHESAPGRPLSVTYRAFPAPVVLASALGPGWDAKGGEIEFRARDGFVSTIEAARLAGGAAWLAFARADGAPFTIDNAGQNEKNVPLGPWYLVWNNRADPASIADGRDWPYEIVDVAFAPDRGPALRPPGLDPSLETGLAATRDNCLTCHKVNGWGGDEAQGDLALLARSGPTDALIRWMLDPSSVDPKTTMPALMAGAPEAERRATAEAIAAYLSRVPIIGR
jgi:hypothetical protein